MAGKSGDDVPMGCGVCRGTLHPVRDPDGAVVRWIHGTVGTDSDGQVSHVTLPVPLSTLAGSVEYRCDFCSATDPVWTYVTSAEHSVTTPDGTLHDFTGGWCACEPCAVLIERRRYRDLARRCAESMKATQRPIAMRHSVGQLTKFALMAHERLWPTIEGRRPFVGEADVEETYRVQRERRGD